ncbi:hypothetical protein CC80DRAFT_550961 [Byssothecium circinans]|uniref:Uncharacterized protein n=1 Tax=Byssothecium circinans TaxID=147558 RepID=A0A6A5TMT7_9PLEO|nr:hypothetical protein CC80DRAFT_550961 [Byssothecium circinans]
MKITSLMTLASWAVGVAAWPVKRDCEETCFNSTNACGVAFGGCWKECEQQRPTFTAPLCSVTLAETTAASTGTHISTSATGTTLITLAPEITPTPTESVSASAVATSVVGCNSGTTICVDYMASCGDRNIMYGGCDDICSSVTYTAPACTVPAITATFLPGNGTEARPTKTRAKRPPTTRTPCKSDKDWMCAPAGW